MMSTQTHTRAHVKMRAHAACVFTKSSSLNVTISPHTHLFFARTHQTNTHTVSDSTLGNHQTVKSHTHTQQVTRFGSFLFLLRCCLLRRRRWSPGWLARQVGRARARACFSNVCMASPNRFGVAMGHCMHAMVRFHSHKHCAEMRGFLDFTWLGHDAKHMCHACVRKMHVIDRHHAWADRSPSFSFLRSRLVFCPSVGSWVDV